MTLEDGTDRLSRNVCQELSIHAALYPRGVKISLTSLRKSGITHKTKFTQRFSRINFRLWAYGTRNQNDVDFGDMNSGDKPRTQVLLYDHESMKTENGAKQNSNHHKFRNHLLCAFQPTKHLPLQRCNTIGTIHTSGPDLSRKKRLSIHITSHSKQFDTIFHTPPLSKRHRGGGGGGRES